MLKNLKIKECIRNMTGDLLAEKIEKLESVFLNILYLKPEE